MNRQNKNDSDSLSTIPIAYKISLEFLECHLFVICIAGYLGNSLNVVIMLRERKLRVYTRTLHIMTSIMDSLVLLVAGLRYYCELAFDYDIRSISYVVKDVHIFLTYFLYDSATWHLCLVSVERAVLVLLPTVVFSRRSPRLIWALVTSATLFSITFVKNAYLLTETLHDNIFAVVDILYNIVLPFGINIGCTYVILMKIRPRSVLPASSTQRVSSPRFAIKTTMFTSVCYIATTMPFAIQQILYHTNSGFKDSHVINIFYSFVSILSLSVYALKFYIFIFASPYLRKIAADIFVRYCVCCVEDESIEETFPDQDHTMSTAQ